MATLPKETLVAFIENADEEIAALNIKIAEAEDALRDLRVQRINVVGELNAFRSAYTRMFNEEPPAPPADNEADLLEVFQKPSTQPADGLVDDGDDNGDWSRMGRSEAVQRAVFLIVKGGHAFASPADIEAFLGARHRDDTRDYIGAALAYLNRTGKVQNKGRGKWVPLMPREAAPS